MQLETRRAPHFVLLLVTTASLLGACGSSAECVVDTDCAALAQRCEANACVPLSTPPLPDLGRVDMAAGDAAVDGGARDAGPTERLSGFFYAQSGPSASVVGASFSQTPPTPAGPCTTRTEGACAVSLCTAAASTSTPRAAGSLTVSGGTAPVTLAPNADDTYTAVTGATELFASGATLTFDATGGSDGGVPAFSGMVIAPVNAVLTAPALADGTPLAPSRTDPLALAWTASGSVGMIDVRFAAALTDGGVASARCRFPVAELSGSIPAAAFTDFPAGGSGSFSFFVEAEDGLAVTGGWNVSLSARIPMTSASGAATSATATF